MPSIAPHRCAARAALLFAVTAFAIAVAPLSALADRGTARLHSGGIVTGDIEVYVPGERVVIRTASGEVIALDIRELDELEIAPERTAPPVVATPPAPVPAAPQATPAVPSTTYIVVPDCPSAPAPYVETPPQHYRLQEPARTPPPGRRPSLFWPLMTLSGSAAAFISGTMLLVDSYYYCDSYYGDSCSGLSPGQVGGVTLMALSLPLFILSASFLLPRKVRARRRHRAAVRDYQLSLTPTASPSTGHYGASATLRF
ncbi:MAG: hypothetical protein KC593_01445 [Myxococcales bacterium]|nr:hypothetical protein [Myxococcales bacterium]MCB9628419.1 hypothetical protein [Sandaracinaceae bacterium]